MICCLVGSSNFAKHLSLFFFRIGWTHTNRGPISSTRPICAHSARSTTNFWNFTICIVWSMCATCIFYTWKFAHRITHSSHRKRKSYLWWENERSGQRADGHGTTDACIFFISAQRTLAGSWRRVGRQRNPHLIGIHRSINYYLFGGLDFSSLWQHAACIRAVTDRNDARFRHGSKSIKSNCCPMNLCGKSWGKKVSFRASHLSITTHSPPAPPFECE